MSQKVRIIKVDVAGATPYLGERITPDGNREDTWSKNPDLVMGWLTDAWRYRFNQLRSRRHKYGPNRGLIPIGNPERVDHQTLPQSRTTATWLEAVPDLVAFSTEKIENQEWFSATKRRKTLLAKGANPGSMPRFRRKDADKIFSCWYNGGRNATYQRTGRRRGIVSITGQNPASRKRDSEKQRFTIRIHVRISEPIRTYTSVKINWTRRTLVFTNPPAGIERTPTGAVIGLDAGITHTLAGSNGTFHDLPRDTMVGLDTRIRHLQKAQARTIKASGKSTRDYRKGPTSRRFQQRDADIARLHARATNVLTDWQHKTSTRLVLDNDVIAVEALQLAQMSRKAKPVPDPVRPGKWLPNGAAAKRGLNRSLRTAALGRMTEMLTYKSAAAGTTLVTVDPRNTSRRCQQCGHIAAENRKSQAVFACTRCGHTCNADTNAARNILERGLRELDKTQGRTAPGAEATSDGEKRHSRRPAGPVKREPLTRIA